MSHACPYFTPKETKDSYVTYVSKCCGARQLFTGTHCSEEDKILLLRKENKDVLE